MSFRANLEGIVTAELTGAEPEKTVTLLSQMGIRLKRLEWTEDLTVRFCFSPGDKRKIAKLCEKRGDTLRFLGETGWHRVFHRLLRRPVLTAGILGVFFMTLYLPTRVFFFQVEGNETIPRRQILAAAEACGIRFGISGKSVRSEKMKNALLEAMPQLKWAGINTFGCRAVISVRERQPEMEREASAGVSSIVAARDGYITSCTVTRGNALCSPGQVVQAGQVLVSGYTDLGICIQVTQAQGEIFAQTVHEFHAVTPSEIRIRMDETAAARRYSLIIGKKRINLWKDSGIWDATCGRMYEEYYITLPGGFCLPVRIGVETLTAAETAVMEQSPEILEPELQRFARASVLQSTVAGSILREEQQLQKEEGRYRLTGRFLCSEMIGRVITEEIGETNGKTD